MRASNSCELGLERLFRGEVVKRHPDVDPRVCGITFRWDSADLKNQRLKIFRTGVLARGRASFARDVFFHQRAAVIIGAGMQTKLGELPVQLHPRYLNIVDRAGQQDAGQRMNFEVLRERRSGPRQALVEEQRVLMHEAKRDELCESSGVGLNGITPS